jgi:hypothetical protein
LTSLFTKKKLVLLNTTALEKRKKQQERQAPSCAVCHLGASAASGMRLAALNAALKAT